MRRKEESEKVKQQSRLGCVIAKSARGEASKKARDEIDGGVEGHSAD